MGGRAGEEMKLDAAQEQSFDPWPDWQRLVSANQPSMSEKITFPTINSHRKALEGQNMPKYVIVNRYEPGSERQTKLPEAPSLQ